MDTKYINIYFNLRHTKIYPNWDFWFENKPSGNPVENTSCEARGTSPKSPSHFGIIIVGSTFSGQMVRRQVVRISVVKAK
jgi:hypothetical protein